MTAEQILLDYLNKINLSNEKKITLLEHSERVSKLCQEFVSALDLNKDRALILNNAAWLHDLAKYKKNGVKRKNHYQKVRKVFEKGNYSIEKNIENKNEIYGIIEAHCEDFRPNKEYILEAAVLRICDKLDKFNKKKDDAEKKCGDSMKEIDDWYKENGLQLPDEFKSTYNKLLGNCKAQL